MPKIAFSLLLFAACVQISLGARLEGQVLNENDQGLPFATLYLENTTIGTATNTEGLFSLEVQPGRYNVIFQYIGYKKKIISINLSEDIKNLVIKMEPETYRLDEVVIKGDGVDPAYKVINAAIDKRKVYENEVNAFTCDAYVKGLQTLTAKPDRFFGFKVMLDSGIVYLSESVSKLNYKRPDKIKEVMISSKVSGRNNAFSYNQASEMLFNPYQNIFYYEGLSERGFVSPIANNALLFYEYKLEGTFFENDLLINKIKVIPKRKTDPVFSGYLYIIEDMWRIHSVDLLLTKSNQIEFVDSLKVNQVYAPVSNDIWMLLSQTFSFSLKAFGFKGAGTFMSVHSNYEIEPNYELIEQDRKLRFVEEERKILFQNAKKIFNNEILAIEEEANKRDDEYWKKIRPVPLTTIEKIDYQVKDSIRVIRESKSYMDSLDRISNKPGITNFLASGYVYSKSYEGKFWRFEPLIKAIQYNTVEGLAANIKISYSKTTENRRVRYRIAPNFRYGFSNHLLSPSVNLTYYANFKTYEKISFGFGRRISQISGMSSISPEINTFETLINRKNYIKLYQNEFIQAGYRRELVNGIMLMSNMEYAQRSPMTNTSNYSLLKDSPAYTPNDPINIASSSTSFQAHRAFILQASLRLRINQTYISRPERKVILESKYPDFFIHYKTGLRMFGSNLNFNKIALEVSHQLNYGLAGRANASASWGYFISKQKMYFLDFHHFRGNRSVFAQFGNTHYQLLDYYQLSTDDTYYMMNYEHHLNGFLFNKIPVLKKTKIQAVGSLHYLYTPDSKSYIEFGASIEHILRIVRVGYYHAILDGAKYRAGFRIGIGF